MNLELDGRVALVSGCSQGLGYACVRTLARHGADIFGVSIGDDSALKKEVEAMGRSIFQAVQRIEGFEYRYESGEGGNCQAE